MNSALHPYRQILSHAVQTRRNEWGRIGPRLLLAAFAGFLVLAWLIDSPGEFGKALCIALLFAVAGIYGGLVGNLFVQNRPLAAKLVPGHVHHLRQALWGVWLVASVPAAAAAFALGLSAQAGALAALWGLGLLAVLLRWPVLWAVAWVLPNLVWWSRGLPILAGPWAWQQAHPSLALLISVLILGTWLGRLLGQGNEQHRRSDRRGRRWRAAARSGETGWAQLDLPRPLCWIRSMIEAPYRIRFTRLCAQPVAHTLPGRLMLGLGPAQHWSTQLGVALVFFTFYFSAVLIVWMLTPAPFVTILRSSTFGIGIGLVSALMARLWSLGKMLGKTRGEQGLLILLPGVARGRALNRLLARRWLWQFGLSWSLGASLLVLASVSLNIGPVAPAMLLIVFAYLMPLSLVCRDWARWEASDGSATVAGLLGLALSMALGLGAYLWLHLPFALVATLQTLVAVIVGIRRWRVQLNAPQALPVSRLA